MAKKDIQRAYRNNEVRTSRFVVGELTAKDDNLKAGEQFVVCTVPAGVFVTRVVAQSVLAGTLDLAIKAGTVIDITSAPTEDQAGVDDTVLGKVFAEATQVEVTVNADINFGKVLVGIEYVDLNTVTGDRVNAVEA